MKPLPSDPYAMQARVMSALMDDMFDLGAGRATTFARTDALRAVSIATAAPLARQMNEQSERDSK